MPRRRRLWSSGLSRLLACAALLGAAEAGAGEPPPVTAPLAFVGVDVVPMGDETVLRDQTVVTEGGVIAAVGPRDGVAIPPGATVIEATGRYLMPGLADLHTHLGFELAEGVDDAANQSEVYLAHGVTTILNMGDTLVPRGEALMRLRDRILAGELAGPTILTASIAYGPEDGVAAHQTVATYEDGRRHVSESRAAGYDLIKVYTRIPPAALDGILDEAREEGLAVVGHIPRQLGLAESLARGLGAITHANQLWCGFFQCSILPSQVPGAISLLKAHGTTIQSTLYLNETFTAVYCGDTAALERFLAQPEMRYVHPLVLDHWRRQAAGFGSSGCHLDEAEPSYRFIQDYSRAFYQAGIPFVLGTDSPPAMGVPGFSLHEELRVVAQALRLRPFQALALATRDAGAFVTARVPDAEPFGRVEAGQRADLLLLAGNPLDSLANVRRVAGVVARGRWFPEADLRSRLERIAGEYGGS